MTAPRALSVLMVLFVTAVLTTACGGGLPGQSSAGAVPGGGAFPVTVQHALGSTVVPAPPQRVLSLGYTDQDAILALGTGDGRPAGLAEPAGWVNGVPVAIR